MGFSSLREQARNLSELRTGQLRRASRSGAATQAGSPALPQLPSPDKHSLAAHVQAPSNRGKRFPSAEKRNGAEPPHLHRLGISSGTNGVVSHRPTISQKVRLSIYLCRYL